MSEENKLDHELEKDTEQAEENLNEAAETETSETKTSGTKTLKTEAPEEENSSEEQGDSSKEGGKENGKKGFFSKKKDKKDEQIEELTERLKRTMAEFDNFRKRTEKEKSAMYEIGAKDMVEKILPVVDNFERGLASVSEEKTPFEEGMDKVYKQFMTTLEEAGVKPIEAVGQPFDPEFHNAVMHIEDEELGENTIAEEFQKGYLYRNSVVRHSMVKVAN